LTSMPPLEDTCPRLPLGALYKLAMGESRSDAAPAKDQAYPSYEARTDKLLSENCSCNPKVHYMRYERGTFASETGALRLTYADAFASAAANDDLSETDFRDRALRAVCCSEHFKDFCKHVRHAAGYSRTRASRRTTVPTPGRSPTLHPADERGPPAYITIADDEEDYSNTLNTEETDDQSNEALLPEDDAHVLGTNVTTHAFKPPFKISKRPYIDLIKSPLTGRAVHASVLRWNPRLRAYMWPPKYYDMLELSPYYMIVRSRLPAAMLAQKDRDYETWNALARWHMGGSSNNYHLFKDPPKSTVWAGSSTLFVDENSPNAFTPTKDQRYAQEEHQAYRHQGDKWTKLTTPLPPKNN
jgi:hypothetical protein